MIPQAAKVAQHGLARKATGRLTLMLSERAATGCARLVETHILACMTDWAHDYFERGYSQRWTLGPPSEDTQREASALWERLRLAAGARVLDVGCGHGRHALALAQRGANVTGLDFSAHLLSRARELAAALDLSVSWIRGDMRALPIRDDSIPAATLFNAFGFFEADEENLHVLREVARVLVTGGRLALKVVNGDPIIRRFRASDREERGTRQS